MTDPLRRPETIDPEPLIAGIRGWVEIETPSERPDLIDALLDRVEADFEGLQVTRERFPASATRGGQLLLRYAPEGVHGRPLTAMGHVDTVWKVWTLARRPVRIAEGCLCGWLRFCKGDFRVTVISADCGHVYGLLARYFMTAGLDEVRYAWVPIMEASFDARAITPGCPGGGPL